jgi:hypothetical protein
MVVFWPVDLLAAKALGHAGGIGLRYLIITEAIAEGVSKGLLSIARFPILGTITAEQMCCCLGLM